MDFVDALLLFGLHTSEAGNLQKKRHFLYFARQISEQNTVWKQYQPAACTEALQTRVGYCAEKFSTDTFTSILIPEWHLFQYQLYKIHFNKKKNISLLTWEQLETVFTLYTSLNLDN